jgi:very-short-patch-repair endonuclease
VKRAKTDKAELFRFAWLAFFQDAQLPCIEAHEEYNFDFALKRKHRFDFAFPDYLVAVEIEGNAWNVKGGGKHMQDTDLEKYNIAAWMGWRVFRYSPAMLKRDPLGCAKQVYEAVSNPGLRGDVE